MAQPALSGLETAMIRTLLVFTALITCAYAVDFTRFDRETLVNRNSHSALEIGPDGHLYATTTNGKLYRYAIDPSNGRIIDEELLLSPGGPLNGLTFDPNASPSNLLFYITVLDSNGRIQRVRTRPWGEANPVLENTTIVAKLGRGGNHGMNNLYFGNDGRLYGGMGGRTMWGTSEANHTAAIMAFDLSHSAFNNNNLPVEPGDYSLAQMWSSYNGSSSPIELFVTGTRNPHGLVQHSNGHWYTTIHDPPRGELPVGGPVTKQVSSDGPPDFVAKVIRGRYYGHCNPKRNQWVAYGGNPTNGKDPYQIPEYPVGLQPLSDFRPELFQPTARNNCIAGLDEYTDGHLLVSYMKISGATTGRIEWFALNGQGNFTGRGGYAKDASGKDLVFNGVLDVFVTSQGWVYVADFGRRNGNTGKDGAIYLLKPVGGNIAPTVAITQPSNGDQLPAGANVTITADANDDNAVTRVEFFINNQKVSTDQNGGNGWSHSWSSPSAGTYAIHATAFDGDGASTKSATVTLQVDSQQQPPTITSTPPSAGYVGSPWTYTVQASGTPAPTFSLQNAPNGMQIDSQSGVISWTPANAGQVDFSVRASNGVQPNAQQPVSVTVASLRAPEYPLGNVAALTGGIEWSSYLVDSGLDALPVFDSLTAEAQGHAAAPTLDMRPRNDHFAMRYVGFLSVPVDGVYTLTTESDDGSQLFIGDNLVVDNNGLHAAQERSGAIALQAGRHAVTITYHEASSDHVLLVKWQGPGVQSGVVPTSAWFRHAQPYGRDRYVPAQAYLNMPTTENGVIPDLLSQTGVFTDTASFTLAPSAMPFDVNSPLWSDGADKQRWFFLPAGEKIRFEATGNWSFPPGSVLVKHFALGQSGQRIETRLNVVTSDRSIYGITYKWRADGSDADIVRTRITETVQVDGASQEWFYPSPQDCISCHTPASGQILGPNTRQLNRDLRYPSTGKLDNILRVLNHLELFEQGPNEADIPQLDRLAALDDTNATLEHRSRSYIDSNCSHCHLPGGVNANWDGRFDTPLAQQGLIDENPLADLGITSAKLIASGHSDRSVVFTRMDTTNTGIMMPPLGRSKIDEDATAVLAAWIAQLPQDNRPPVITAAITANPDPVTGVSTDLSVGVDDPDGDTLQLTWSASPNTVQFSDNSATPTATFSEAGTYTITVDVSDGNGGTTQAQRTLDVEQTPSTLSIDP